MHACTILCTIMYYTRARVFRKIWRGTENSNATEIRCTEWARVASILQLAGNQRLQHDTMPLMYTV